MCVSVYTMASEELRLWRQSPAHIFAGLNLSGYTLYKHSKAPLHRGFCYKWLDVCVYGQECERMNQCMLITPIYPRGLNKSQLMNWLEQHRLFAFHILC